MTVNEMQLADSIPALSTQTKIFKRHSTRYSTEPYLRDAYVPTDRQPENAVREDFINTPVKCNLVSRLELSN